MVAVECTCACHEGVETALYHSACIKWSKSRITRAHQKWHCLSCQCLHKQGPESVWVSSCAIAHVIACTNGFAILLWRVCEPSMEEEVHISSIQKRESKLLSVTTTSTLILTMTLTRAKIQTLQSWPDLATDKLASGGVAHGHRFVAPIHLHAEALRTRQMAKQRDVYQLDEGIRCDARRATWISWLYLSCMDILLHDWFSCPCAWNRCLYSSRFVSQHSGMQESIPTLL